MSNKKLDSGTKRAINNASVLSNAVQLIAGAIEMNIGKSLGNVEGIDINKVITERLAQKIGDKNA